jgi:hypothetical protein
MAVRSLRLDAPHTNVEITAKINKLFMSQIPSPVHQVERRHSWEVNNHGFWNKKLSVSSPARIISRPDGNNYIYEYFVHLDCDEYSHK